MRVVGRPTQRRLELRVVLPERRRDAGRDRRLREAGERARIPGRRARCLHLVPEAACGELLRVVELRHGRNRDDQQAAFQRLGHQPGLRLRAEESADDVEHPQVLLRRLLAACEEFHVADPVLVPGVRVAHALLVDPLHEEARERANGAEEEGQGDVSIRRLPDKREGHRTQLHAPAGPGEAGVAVGVGEQERLHGLGLRLLRRDIDQLPAPGDLALPQGDQGGLRRLDAGVEERLRDAEAQGCAVLIAQDRRPVRRRTDGDVGGGPVRLRTVLSERADGDVDELGIQGGEVRMAEAACGHPTGRGGLDQDVGRGDQLPQAGSPLARVQVDRHRALVAREGLPGQRPLDSRGISDERAAPPRRIAVGRLDRDDIRAEVGQDHPGDQTAVVGEIQHPVCAEQEAALLVPAGSDVTRPPGAQARGSGPPWPPVRAGGATMCSSCGASHADRSGGICRAGPGVVSALLPEQTPGAARKSSAT